MRRVAVNRVQRKGAGDHRLSLSSQAVLSQAISSQAILSPAILLRCAVMLVLPVIGHAFPDGAPPGFTGGFGEADCSTCHFGESAVEAAVRFTDVAGAEIGTDQGVIVVAAGTTLDLQLTISHPELKVVGLQAAMRNPDGSNQSVSDLHWNPSQFNLTKQNSVDYVTHRAPLAATAGELVISLAWDVPDTPLEAILHIAMVLGNDDQSPLGDYVHRFQRRFVVR